MNNQDYNPKILVSDGDIAIHNAFKRVFGDDAIIKMCWVHVLRNIKRVLTEYFGKDKQTSELLLSDIIKLHYLTSPESFKKGFELFYLKWKPTHNGESPQGDFLKYFKAQWVEKIPGWYLGYCFGYPSHNNGIEGMNSAIKRIHTKYIIKNFPEMHHNFLQYTRSFSINGLYNESKHIKLTPTITKMMRQDGYYLCDFMNKNQCWYVQKYNASINAVIFRQGNKKWIEYWSSFDQILTINNNNNFEITFPGKSFFLLQICINSIIIHLRIKGDVQGTLAR